MTRTPERGTDSRQKSAAKNMSLIQNFVRALQSGPIKNELRTVQESIHAARALATQMESMMKSPAYAKGPENPKGFQNPAYAKDFHTAIAYVTPDLSILSTFPYEPGKEAEIHERLSGPGTCCIPVGLIFGVRDPERGGWWSGARPFLNTQLVITALKQRVEENMIGVN